MYQYMNLIKEKCEQPSTRNLLNGTSIWLQALTVKVRLSKLIAV